MKKKIFTIIALSVLMLSALFFLVSRAVVIDNLILDIAEADKIDSSSFIFYYNYIYTLTALIECFVGVGIGLVVILLGIISMVFVCKNIIASKKRIIIYILIVILALVVISKTTAFVRNLYYLKLVYNTMRDFELTLFYYKELFVVIIVLSLIALCVIYLCPTKVKLTEKQRVKKQGQIEKKIKSLQKDLEELQHKETNNT